MCTIMHHKLLTIALTLGLVAASAGAYPLGHIVAGKLPIFQSATATETVTDDQAPAYVGTTPLFWRGDMEDDF